MFNIDGEKDKPVKKLSKKYSKNMTSMEEYEPILEYNINKIKPKKK
jgi:hypothetical protein